MIEETSKTRRADRIIQIVLICIVALLTFIPFYIAAFYVDINHEAMAFDWRNSYHGAIYMENFGWDVRAFRMPFYAMPYFLPFTGLSFSFGWSVMMYLTAVALVVSVPSKMPRRLWLLGMLLLFISHPTMRNFADVNVEGFVIIGLVLSQFAFAHKRPFLLGFAVLVAAIKPQEVSLVMVVLSYYLLRDFSWPEKFKFGAVVIGEIAITFLLWGRTYFQYFRNDRAALALGAGLPAFGIPESFVLPIQILIAIITVAVALRGKRELSHLRLGFLVVGSLLSAPYFNGLSATTILAFGGMALLMKRPWLGGLFFLVYNIPYLRTFGVDFIDTTTASYWMLVLLLSWIVLGFELFTQTTKDTIDVQTKEEK